jgi:hypothetical protein
MSVRLQDFHFTIKVNKASPDLGSSPPPPPPPPPPPSPLVAGGDVQASGWVNDGIHADAPGMSALSGSLAGSDILF